MFALQNMPHGRAARSPAWRAARDELEPRAAKFDLSLALDERGRRGRRRHRVRRRPLRRGTVRAPGGAAATRCCERARRDPDAPASALPTLRPGERERWRAWSRRRAPRREPGRACSPRCSRAGGAHARTRRRSSSAARRSPTRELDARAEPPRAPPARAGRGARDAGRRLPGAQPRAGGGVLAVLKAGGAYVPLDPAYPAERLGVHAGRRRRRGRSSPRRRLRGRRWHGRGGRRGLDVDAAAIAAEARTTRRRRRRRPAGRWRTSSTPRDPRGGPRG